jgi:hypothetical protein
MTLEADGATVVRTPHNEPVAVRALLPGERLNTRSIESSNVLSTAPVTTSIVGGGIAGAEHKCECPLIQINQEILREEASL